MTTRDAETGELFDAHYPLYCHDCGYLIEDCRCDEETTRDEDLGFEIVSDAQCSCWSAAPDFAGHFSDCALLTVDEFELGFAYWDHALKALIELPEDVRDAVNADPSLDPHTVMFDALSDALDALEVNAQDDSSVASLVAGHKGTTGPAWAESAWEDFGGHASYKCYHVQDEVILPDGTIVYASSHHGRTRDELIPDLGVYLDGSWRPDCRAFHVGCPDYRTPVAAPQVVIGIAREALEIARDGKRVEVGCIGGHGRTGLMLAIMTLIVVHDQGGRMEGDKATAYVRHMHCKSAVESREQEWYIRGMGCELRGEVWPTRPRPRKVKTAAGSKYKYVKNDQDDVCKGCGHWTKHSELIPCTASCKNADGRWTACGCAIGQGSAECGRCRHVNPHGVKGAMTTCWCGCTGPDGAKVSEIEMGQEVSVRGNARRNNNRRNRNRGKGRGRGGRR